ncbi:hypothetical protein HPB50_004407 [Hyalomma asiaticum]|uniref:Uncharacterized protein n=1 Tax=Hyalomma asiaticum TaxID=266040 RepID=A0ACB7RPC2_HYAAI|nr:hypothetical protein HPB50_004407 [Hyalomma asiaticum]
MEPKGDAIHAIDVKLPPFWTADPELWFVQLESQFTARALPPTKVTPHGRRPSTRSSQRGTARATDKTAEAIDFQENWDKTYRIVLAPSYVYNQSWTGTARAPVFCQTPIPVAKPRSGAQFDAGALTRATSRWLWIVHRIDTRQKLPQSDCYRERADRRGSRHVHTRT